MRPMQSKSVAMQETIDQIFPGTLAAIADGRCPHCGSIVGVFRDRLSQREFSISGLCQSCQDEIFNSEDKDDES